MKSKLLAVSAISASLTAIILTIGAYVSMADLFCLTISSVTVLLPLYFKSYKAGFLSFLAGGVIAFVFSGFNITVVVVPAFLLFFGSFPLIKCLMMEKKVKFWLAYVIGLIWCLLAVYGIYFFYVNVMAIDFSYLPPIVNKYIILFVGLLGLLFYVVFERYVVTMKRLMDIYLVKIIK